MKITFDTQSENEVHEVVGLLKNMGVLRVRRQDEVEVTPESKSKVGTSPKEDKTIPESTPKSKKTPEPEKETAITLADLKELAKNKVTSSSRGEVKKIISEFAEKLAEVKPEDYVKLAEKLS